MCGLQALDRVVTGQEEILNVGDATENEHVEIELGLVVHRVCRKVEVEGLDLVEGQHLRIGELISHMEVELVEVDASGRAGNQSQNRPYRVARLGGEHVPCQRRQRIREGRDDHAIGVELGLEGQSLQVAWKDEITDFGIG